MHVDLGPRLQTSLILCSAAKEEWKKFLLETSLFASRRLVDEFSHLALVKRPDGTDAVIKAALSPEAVKELETERQAYKKLSRLQGKQIPLFFARGRVSIVIDEVDAIAIEYIDGDSSSLRADRMTSQTRFSILRLFRSIWELRVVHGDVAFRNIGKRKAGDLVLYDFGRAVLSASDEEIEEECQEVYELLGRPSDEDTESNIDWQ